MAPQPLGLLPISLLRIILIWQTARLNQSQSAAGTLKPVNNSHQAPYGCTLGGGLVAEEPRIAVSLGGLSAFVKTFGAM